ncbi:phage tail-like protein [Kitasatospora sp. MAP12-15]|uniref:phage tail protein n=1 Tax=unclassified Kitasatospora TaxID=2633591 RepID=UPI0024765231|nr:phage tail protein [Kitasatospora sp. MAP12-44]MDH6113648.1 phage tail-like protein [Kitasatospora sp. MAP12-44]
MTAEVDPGGRRAVAGLASPHPLGERLPGVYAEDDFTQRFLGAFDDVLAPVFAVLDCLDSYWAPEVAPADFLDWLAGWVAAETSARADGEPAPLAERRALVAEAIPSHRLRGTARGLVERLRQLDVEAEVIDSGGSSWSATPNGPLPGTPRPAVLVRVRTADRSAASLRRIEALVERERPAHVDFRVELRPE